MNIEQLTYIAEVAKTGSLSIAAQNLHVTLSGISQAISNLEDELEIQIFRRTRQGTTPTEEGTEVIKKAIEALNQITSLKEIAQGHSKRISGELKIATVPGQMALIINTLATFKKDFPNIKIKIDEKGSQEIIEDVKNDKTDIGIVIFHDEIVKRGEGLVFEVLQEVTMKACVSKDNLLTKYETIVLADLQNQSFVLYDDDYVKWYFENFINKQSSIDLLFTTNNVDSLRSAIDSNTAITICLDYTAKSEPYILSGQAVAIDIINPDQASVDLVWVRAKDRHFSAVAKNFIKRLQAELYRNSCN
ncbi:LysR family transcriptional regulator [Gottfriedia sp. NPDC057948]|uniref:LysR family transcriptional regulator n=1 Tax=Gottfriedia sp. NPDC057948 TaxID=3346287 RepID=UPI0036DC23C4